MVDEVQIVTWGDGHGAASPLCQAGIGLVQGLVDVHKRIDDGLAVGRCLGQLWVYHRKVLWKDILLGGTGTEEQGGRSRGEGGREGGKEGGREREGEGERERD